MKKICNVRLFFPILCQPGLSMNKQSYIFILGLCLTFCAGAVFPQEIRSITLKTEPNAIVWTDGVKRGVTDEEGKLDIKPLARGTKTLRVRAFGFKEITKSLLPTTRGALNLPLVKTTDKAELAFQEAEKLVDEDKEKAIGLYREAVRLRPRYAEAFVGLARALTGSDNEEALASIRKARRLKPVYPEASTVEGRIYRSEDETDKAIDSFERAIKEGRGFEPEAYTGLGLIFKEEAEGAAAAGDLEDEKYYYEEAAKSFEKAVAQFYTTEPIVYMFLGEIYEKMDEGQKAIDVYNRFLKDFPSSDERSVVESFIVQIKKEMAGGNND